MPENFFQNLQQGVADYTNVGTSVPDPGFRLADSEDLKQQVLKNISQVEAEAQKRLLDFSKSDTLAPGANIYGVQRLPWVFATFDSLTAQDLDTASRNVQTFGSTLPEGSIVWTANPSAVSWSISQRGTETKTKAGTVLTMWRDRARKTDYDDPKLTISFQTGNIMPAQVNAVDPNSVSGPIRISPGLEDFYRYLQLVDAPKITKDGQANLIHILYRSRIFPSMVLSGFFDPQTVVKFEDSSDTPFKISGWSSTFTVYNTIPRLNSFSELRDRFNAEFSNDPLSRVDANDLSRLNQV